MRSVKFRGGEIGRDRSCQCEHVELLAGVQERWKMTEGSRRAVSLMNLKVANELANRHQGWTALYGVSPEYVSVFR